MAASTGIWIDHDRAIFVELNGGASRVWMLESHAEHRHKSIGSAGVHPPGHLHGAPSTKYEHRRENEITAYYRDIIKAVAGADQLFLFGPSQAKDELLKEMKHAPKIAAKVCAVEPAQSMTEPQLVAHVKQFFKTRRQPHTSDA